MRDLDKAYQNFFRGLKDGCKFGYPRFKSKRDSKQTYRTQNNQTQGKDGSVRSNTIVLYDDCIRLPKLGYVECRVSKKMGGRILSATVTKASSGKYFVSVNWTDANVPRMPRTDKMCGIDLGIKDLAVLSDGTVYPNHKHLSESEKKLKCLQRSLSRKQKGSRNWEKARIRVARQHEKVRNQRQDALHKMTTQIVREHGIICMETLRPANMMKNHHLARAVQDASFHEIVRQIKYKCGWHDRTLVQIEPFFPSSQLCSRCGCRNPVTKDLSVREWVCSDCGAVHDRDMNAAANILNEGIRILS